MWTLRPLDHRQFCPNSLLANRHARTIAQTASRYQSLKLESDGVDSGSPDIQAITA